jgi:hypothetical protein
LQQDTQLQLKLDRSLTVRQGMAHRLNGISSKGQKLMAFIDNEIEKLE